MAADELPPVEDIVVVGAGIAGLATAAALHRIGRRSIVLESNAELRATGAAITLMPNAWSALRALGVADKLTSVYRTFEITRVTNLATGATNTLGFAGTANKGETEVRPVHRKALLEALAGELPPGTIKFSSRVVSVESSQDYPGVASVLLDDGSVILTKVLIGCDGVRSAVARWLGFAKAIHSGRSAIRGLAVFPDGHRFSTEFRQYLAPGLRAGIMPISDTDLYWFLVNDTVPSEHEIARDPERILREVTDRFCKDFPEEYLAVVRRSDLSNVTWAPLEFRSPCSILLTRGHRGAVAVAGDAFHPMTPDLAQGGCLALEDAVVLAREMAAARSAEDGVAAYFAARRRRSAWVVAGACVCGWVQQGGVGVGVGVWGKTVKWFRDRIFYPFVFPWLADSMRFDCPSLSPPSPTAASI